MYQVQFNSTLLGMYDRQFKSNELIIDLWTSDTDNWKTTSTKKGQKIRTSWRTFPDLVRFVVRANTHCPLVLGVREMTVEAKLHTLATTPLWCRSACRSPTMLLTAPPSDGHRDNTDVYLSRFPHTILILLENVKKNVRKYLGLL